MPSSRSFAKSSLGCGGSLSRLQSPVLSNPSRLASHLLHRFRSASPAAASLPPRAVSGAPRARLTNWKTRRMITTTGLAQPVRANAAGSFSAWRTGLMKARLFGRRVGKARGNWRRLPGYRQSLLALRSRGILPLAAALGILVLLLGWQQPSAARDWRPSGRGGWGRPLWAPGPPTFFFPASLPYSSRLYFPPGTPLSFDDAAGMTYCLSVTSGIYYMCGYSRPTGEALEAIHTSPAFPAFPIEQRASAPSGVLLFRLPQDGEATVDGVPVGLSGGLGVTAVTPGRHQVLVRASGSEAEHTVTISPHSIFTVTPTAVVPTGP